MLGRWLTRLLEKSTRNRYFVHLKLTESQFALPYWAVMWNPVQTEVTKSQRPLAAEVDIFCKEE